jgi:hypothetical protein
VGQLPALSAFGPTIVLSAIQRDEAEDEVTIKPLGLRRKSTDSVHSVDAEAATL